MMIESWNFMIPVIFASIFFIDYLVKCFEVSEHFQKSIDRFLVWGEDLKKYCDLENADSNRKSVV